MVPIGGGERFNPIEKIQEKYTLVREWVKEALGDPKFRISSFRLMKVTMTKLSEKRAPSFFSDFLVFVEGERSRGKERQVEYLMMDHDRFFYPMKYDPRTHKYELSLIGEDRSGNKAFMLRAESEGEKQEMTRRGMTIPGFDLPMAGEYCEFQVGPYHVRMADVDIEKFPVEKLRELLELQE